MTETTHMIDELDPRAAQLRIVEDLRVRDRDLRARYGAEKRGRHHAERYAALLEGDLAHVATLASTALAGDDPRRLRAALENIIAVTRLRRPA